MGNNKWPAPPALPAPYPQWVFHPGMANWYIRFGNSKFRTRLFAYCHSTGELVLFRNGRCICETTDKVEFVRVAVAQIYAHKLGLL